MAKKIDIKGDIISNDSVWLYDWIGWEYTSPGKIKAELSNANGEDVEFQVNSPGGDVFAGYEIFNTIRNYEGYTTSRLVGLAASCGSFIPLASEKVIAEPLSMMMIHGASTSTWGNQRDHEQSRDFLANVDNTIVQAYTSKSGKTSEEMLDLMTKETWFTPQQMLEMGLIDEIAGENVQTSKVTVYNSSEDEKKHKLIDKLLELGNVDNVEKAIIEGKFNLGQLATNSVAIDNKSNQEEDKVMNAEELKAQYPDLCNQIAQEAKNQEKERINAINQLRGKVPQDMIDKGIEEGKTAENVAYNAMLAQPSVNKHLENELKNDAEESGVNDVAIASSPQNTNEQEKQSALFNMANIMNGGRK